jgi:MoaA/NifB/PqqE/SkfB family radical SAM enzyme
MDYVKQYDTKHKIQRLYVHWDVSTQCNFKCTYCYAMKDYGDEWGKIDKWFKQKLIINNIARSNLPVFLGLLGGEPTLHPKYYELIDLCLEAVTKHKDGRLYITTNGSQDENIFKNHQFHENLYFLFSFHPEFEVKYKKGFKILLNNIKIAVDRGFRVKVNVMLHNKKKYWERTHKFVDELEKYGDRIDIHPHFLYGDGDVHKLEDYNLEFYREFVRFKNYPDYFTFEDNKGNKTIYNDYNIFENKFTSFKNWDCWNNNYEISYDGYVHKVCFEGKVNLVSNPFYFKNITRICPVKCPHSNCNCDGLLKIYKEKNG